MVDPVSLNGMHLFMLLISLSFSGMFSRKTLLRPQAQQMTHVDNLRLNVLLVKLMVGQPGVESYHICN